MTPMLSYYSTPPAAIVQYDGMGHTQESNNTSLKLELAAGTASIPKLLSLYAGWITAKKKTMLNAIISRALYCY